MKDGSLPFINYFKETKEMTKNEVKSVKLDFDKIITTMNFK